MLPLNYTLLLTTLLLVFSCAKTDEPDQVKTNQAQDEYRIEMISPSADTSLTLSDSIQLNILMHSPWGLHEYTVKLTDKDKNECFYEEGHSHDWAFRYNRKIKAEPYWVSPINLEVVTNNHDGELRQKQVQIIIKP